MRNRCPTDGIDCPYKKDPCRIICNRTVGRAIGSGQAVLPPLGQRLDAQEVIETREDTHGDYRKQAETAQRLKAHFRDVRNFNGGPGLTHAQCESLDMIAVKISRILHGDANEPDHWTDIAGYATLISNLLTKGTHL